MKWSVGVARPLSGEPRRQTMYTLGRSAAAPRLRVGGRRAFTLVEMLVVAAILTLLLSILVPALKSARDQMKTLMCASNLKTATQRFNLFAEGLNKGGRGRSAVLGKKQFWADDYQAWLYGADRFWSGGDRTTVAMNARSEVLMCPAGPRELTKTRGVAFSDNAIRPQENISVGMNGRLYRAAVAGAGSYGEQVLAEKDDTAVGIDILSHPFVPLLFDVDGVEAVGRAAPPHYSAPPIRDPDDPYSDGANWNPSSRHRGGTNVSFVGGHVQSSKNPSRESWDWNYQAMIRDTHYAQ